MDRSCAGIGLNMRVLMLPSAAAFEAAAGSWLAADDRTNNLILSRLHAARFSDDVNSWLAMEGNVPQLAVPLDMVRDCTPFHSARPVNVQSLYERYTLLPEVEQPVLLKYSGQRSAARAFGIGFISDFMVA